MICDIGDEVELIGVFTSRRLSDRERDTYLSTGTLPAEVVALTPGDVTCTVLKPDGETEIPTVDPYVLDSEPLSGAYVATVLVGQAGAWAYAYDGEDPAKSAGERTFVVRRQRVPRDEGS
jgi:hypothetical protein